MRELLINEQIISLRAELAGLPLKRCDEYRAALKLHILWLEQSK